MKKYQYRLTQSECQLHNHLRELEADLEDEFPELLDGSVLPKLSKQMTLSLKLGGHEIESFDLDGARLIQHCASIGAKILRKLLTSEERDFDQVEPPVGDESINALPSPITTVSSPGRHKDLTSWESLKNAIIPTYVQGISFAVPKCLGAEDREDLHARFPDVMITDQALPENGASDDDVNTELQSQFAAESRPTRSTQTDFEPLVLGTSISTAAVIAPNQAVATTVRPGVSSRMSVDESEIRSKGIAAKSVDEVDALAGSRKPSSPFDILRVAERIGFQITFPPKDIHAIWLHWQNKREVKSFPQVRRYFTLQQYYSNLVTLYILAHHRKEEDLCFALLLKFQATNYAFSGSLPDVPTVVLAFQYLPEDSGFCRWTAVLFAFLWGTQEYHDHNHLLTVFPSLDRHALSKLLFAVAHIRDPCTKGHDTAVLDRWCEVHHHTEGDEKEVSCKQVRDEMKARFDKLRGDDAKRDYEEAQVTIRNFVKNLGSQNFKAPRVEPYDGSMWTVDSKRKVEGPAVQSNKKYKGGGGADRLNRASS